MPRKRPKPPNKRRIPVGRPVKAGSSGLFRRSIAAAVLSVAMLAGAAAQPILIEIESASVGYDQRNGEPVVGFKMTAASQRLFAEFTVKNIGRKVEIRVDGRLLSAPVIREPILGGAGQISSKFTVQDAQDIAARLSSGRSRLEIEAAD